MKVGVLLTISNSADWRRLLDGDRARGPAVPDRDVFDNIMLFGERIEALGFDSIWTTEHYGSPYGMNGSPMQFLSYWAARTERVDLGSAVLVLPWWDPVRLATEMAMLDSMLGDRRFIPGVGRGVAPAEFDSLRIPRRESRQRFYEVLDIIRLADTQEVFSYDGIYYRVPETSIRPQPLRKGHLLDDVRGAFTSRIGAETASKKGLGQLFVAGEPVAEMAANCATFNEVRVAAGLLPDQPTVLRVARCVPDRSSGEDLERAFSRMMEDVRFHYAVWGRSGPDPVVRAADDLQPADLSGAIDFREQRIAEQAAAQLIGTPDQIVEKVLAMQQAVSNDTLVLQFLPQGMPLADAFASLELFAREVLPVLRDLQTPLHPCSLGEAVPAWWGDEPFHTSGIPAQPTDT